MCLFQINVNWFQMDQSFFKKKKRRVISFSFLLINFLFKPIEVCWPLPGHRDLRDKFFSAFLFIREKEKKNQNVFIRTKMNKSSNTFSVSLQGYSLGKVPPVSFTDQWERKTVHKAFEEGIHFSTRRIFLTDRWTNSENLFVIVAWGIESWKSRWAFVPFLLSRSESNDENLFFDCLQHWGICFQRNPWPKKNVSRCWFTSADKSSLIARPSFSSSSFLFVGRQKISSRRIRSDEELSDQDETKTLFMTLGIQLHRTTSSIRQLFIFNSVSMVIVRSSIFYLEKKINCRASSPPFTSDQKSSRDSNELNNLVPVPLWHE